jgi:hypothetical protein
MEMSLNNINHPSLQSTFGIHTRLALNPKMPKELFSPSREDKKMAVPDKTKISIVIKRKWLILNKAQCLARNIRKPGDAGNLNFYAEKELTNTFANKIVYPN